MSAGEPATLDDLAWWWDLAPTLEWTWAKTYATDAPHWYLVGGRTPGFTRADARRVARLVRTFGEPGKFYSMTNLYLWSPDRLRKAWCMFSDPPAPGDADVRIVNLAKTEATPFGPQSGFDQARLDALALPPGRLASYEG